MARRGGWPLRGTCPLVALVFLLCIPAANGLLNHFGLRPTVRRRSEAADLPSAPTPGDCAPEAAADLPDLPDDDDESQLMKVQLMQTKRHVTKKARQAPATEDASLGAGSASGAGAEHVDPNFLLSYSREERFRHESEYESAREVARESAQAEADQVTVEAPDVSLRQAIADESAEAKASSDEASAFSADMRAAGEPGQDPMDELPADGAEAVHIARLTRVGNSDGDIYAFASAVTFNIFMCLTLVIIFSFLRRAWPQIYSNNVMEFQFELKPVHDRPGCGWMWYAFTCDTARWTDMIGLDGSMMIEFMDLCIRILIMIGIPILCIEGPLNYEFGGNAAGNDVLSYLSFANVDPGHPWLYYVHAGTVWYVIVVVQWNIYRAQEGFLKRRVSWLKSVPEERARTILVDGIPDEARSDEELKKFFEQMMGDGAVEKVYLVKDTRLLASLEDQRSRVKQRIKEAERSEERLLGGVEAAAQVEEQLQRQRPDHGQAEVEREERRKLQEELDRLSLECDKESKKLWEQSRQKGAEGVPNPVNLTCGFVKFKKRKTAQMALTLSISADSAEWALSTAPDSNDILWADLTCDPNAQAVWDAVGMALVVGLYFAYLPLVVGVANVATALDLGPMQPLWEGLAPTMGLQLMVSFLPSILLLIFRTCFAVKAHAWSQAKLQNWYFWFQIVFVILVFAVGDSITDFAAVIVADPTAIFGLLAETMPHATHFYMNFQVLQWTIHCLALIRFAPLWNYTGLRKLYEEEEAIALSDPEDQAYHGLGSRCASNTINMLIALIYGTICPPMNFLALINFMICRFVYGYLLPFAERKKADLGGIMWVRQLENLFIGLLIYSILMTGVLIGRAPTVFPALIAGPAIFYVLWSAERFETEFNWELLPFEEVAKGFKDEALDQKRKAIFNYVQPGMEKELERQEDARYEKLAAEQARIQKTASWEKRPKDRLPPAPSKTKDTSR